MGIELRHRDRPDRTLEQEREQMDLRNSPERLGISASAAVESPALSRLRRSRTAGADMPSWRASSAVLALGSGLEAASSRTLVSSSRDSVIGIVVLTQIPTALEGIGVVLVIAGVAVYQERAAPFPRTQRPAGSASKSSSSRRCRCRPVSGGGATLAVSRWSRPPRGIRFGCGATAPSWSVCPLWMSDAPVVRNISPAGRPPQEPRTL